MGATQTAAPPPVTFHQVPTDAEKPTRDVSPDRLISLDAFRGFIMTALAADAFGLRIFMGDPQLGWLGGQFEHVEWTGLHFWDLIQPAFMFMVGLAMPFAFAARARRYGTEAVWKHVAYRALMLIVISQIIMSISRGEAFFQLINVLSQIGFAYFCAWLIMQLPFRAQIGAAAGILIFHTALFVLFPGADGPWDKANNIGARIDHLFGLEYSGFYVTINFISSTVTTLFGVWCGYLMREKFPHAQRIKIMAAAVAGLGLSGWLLSFAVPSVKRLWTASFTLISGAWVIGILLAFYWLVEVREQRKLTFPLVVVGMNSIFIYCVHIVLNGWLDDAVAAFTGRFQALGPQWGHVAQAACMFAVLWYLCYWLYRRRIFIRV